MGYEWIGFFLVVTLVLAATGLTLATQWLSSRAKLWILCGLACVVVGALMRYFIYETFYGGQKDARTYFKRGVVFARHFAALDFGVLFDPEMLRRGPGSAWWGTNFIDWAAGAVLTFTGPTQRGGYLAFALLALAGRLCIWRSPARLNLPVDQHQFLFWLLLWPSLWWWTSVLGKDALILLGLGLAVLGYAGKEDRIRWLLLIPGVTLVFCVRPEVAAVTTMALILAHWLSFQGGWTAKRALQGVLLLSAGIGLMLLAMQAIGIRGVEGAQAYLAANAESVSTGGSAIDPVGVSWYGAPLALVNVWFRPFPWEADNAFVVASGLEIYLLWGLLWYRWRSVAYALRDWRSNRLLRFALPFVVVYSVLLGMAITNLSIISRQRLFIFPFFFLLICWQRPEERAARESHSASSTSRAAPA